jgi:hypothetical protein
MSRVQDSELSMLGAQLDELQALLERRIDEERQTRQQTLVGLERWISDQLANRDRTDRARLAEATGPAAAITRPSQIRNTQASFEQTEADMASARPSTDALELSGLIHALRDRLDTMETHLAFMNARQDEFMELLATVRGWIAAHTSYS